MSLVSAKDILDGKYAVGSTVTLAGWLRTRRDSKAGFSFLAINDGSCFNNVQVIADKSLNNYESEILSLTTGCSLAVEGTLEASQGKGQAFGEHANDQFVALPAAVVEGAQFPHYMNFFPTVYG